MSKAWKQVAKEMIEAGIRAPSGDNSQPWRFKITENQIHIYNIPENDPSFYNFQQRGSYLSHGAVAENMSIVAGNNGLACQIEFVAANPSQLVAKLICGPGVITDTGLGPYIFQRATNRRAFSAKKIEPAHREKIMSCAQTGSRGELILIEDREVIKTMAQAVSVNEKIFLGNEAVHKNLFSLMRWSKQEEQEKKCGLYANTLELKWPQMMVFRLLKDWPMLKRLNRLGISKLIALESARLTSSAAALGIVMIKNETQEDYFKAGRLFERVWLEALKMGLQVQPTTGIPYLAAGIKSGDYNTVFSKPEQELILKASDILYEKIGALGGSIAMVFRVGYGPAAHFFSSRKEPIIEFI